MCIHMYVCPHACVQLLVVYMYVTMYMYYVCMYVRVCLYVCMIYDIRMYECLLTHSHLRMYARMYVRVRRLSACTRMLAYTHVCM
jgi:hypothetical protein